MSVSTGNRKKKQEISARGWTGPHLQEPRVDGRGGCLRGLHVSMAEWRTDGILRCCCYGRRREAEGTHQGVQRGRAELLRVQRHAHRPGLRHPATPALQPAALFREFSRSGRTSATSEGGPDDEGARSEPDSSKSGRDPPAAPLSPPGSQSRELELERAGTRPIVGGSEQNDRGPPGEQRWGGRSPAEAPHARAPEPEWQALGLCGLRTHRPPPPPLSLCKASGVARRPLRQARVDGERPGPGRIRGGEARREATPTALRQSPQPASGDIRRSRSRGEGCSPCTAGGRGRLGGRVTEANEWWGIRAARAARGSSEISFLTAYAPSECGFATGRSRTRPSPRSRARSARQKRRRGRPRGPATGTGPRCGW